MFGKSCDRCFFECAFSLKPKLSSDPVGGSDTGRRPGRDPLIPRLFLPVHPISDDTTLTAVSSAVSADLEGEAVVLDTATGEYYGLNEIGARIWTLLQEPMTFSALVDVLLEEYAVDRDRCEEEVGDLLGQMKEKNLLDLEPVDSNPPE